VKKISIALIMAIIIVLASCGDPSSTSNSDGGGGGNQDPTWGTWQTVTEPTCTTAGLKKRVRSDGLEQTESIPALGHTWVVTSSSWTTVQPTFDEDGYEYRTGTGTCSRCGATGETVTEKQNIVTKLKHVSNITYKKPGTDWQVKSVEYEVRTKLNELAAQATTMGAYPITAITHWTDYQQEGIVDSLNGNNVNAMLADGSSLLTILGNIVTGIAGLLTEASRTTFKDQMGYYQEACVLKQQQKDDVKNSGDISSAVNTLLGKINSSTGGSATTLEQGITALYNALTTTMNSTAVGIYAADILQQREDFGEFTGWVEDVKSFYNKNLDNVPQIGVSQVQEQNKLTRIATGPTRAELAGKVGIML